MANFVSFISLCVLANKKDSFVNEDEYEANEQQLHPQRTDSESSSSFDRNTGALGATATVVSARTPTRQLLQLQQQQQQQKQQQLQQAPPVMPVGRPPLNTNGNNNNNNGQGKFAFPQRLPPAHAPSQQLSLSHRVETTSTPLQLPPPPSASLRGVAGASVMRDGATDV